MLWHSSWALIPCALATRDYRGDHFSYFYVSRGYWLLQQKTLLCSSNRRVILSDQEDHL